MAISRGRSAQSRSVRETSGPISGNNAYRLALAEVVRLQDQSSPGLVARVAGHILRATLGPVSGCLFYAVSETKNRFEPFDEGGGELTQRSMIHALLREAVARRCTVSPGGGSGPGFAVPLRAEDDVLGAFYVEGPGCHVGGDPSMDLEDLLAIIGRHLGTALSRALKGRAAAASMPSLKQAKDAFEQRLVRKHLAESGGNISQAARCLHVDRGQLSRLVKKYGIDRSRYKM